MISDLEACLALNRDEVVDPDRCKYLERMRENASKVQANKVGPKSLAQRKKEQQQLQQQLQQQQQQRQQQQLVPYKGSLVPTPQTNNSVNDLLQTTANKFPSQALNLEYVSALFKIMYYPARYGVHLYAIMYR